MFFIPGELIAILTFPGIIIHEMGHKLFCTLAGIPVYKTCYFRIGNPAGYVIHEPVQSYEKDFLICVAPIIVNTAIAIFIFAIALNTHSLAVVISLYWLGISIGMNAFPSSGDADNIWQHSKEDWRHNTVAILGFPIVILIKIANVLSIIWFDLLYAIALLLIVGVSPVILQWLA